MEVGGIRILLMLAATFDMFIVGVQCSAIWWRTNYADTPTKQRDGIPGRQTSITQLEVEFDPAYGGVYGTVEVSLGGKHDDAFERFERVTFSSRHSRTFLVHGDPSKCKMWQDGDGKMEDAKFCREHRNTLQIPSESDALLHKMKNDLTNKGDYVEGVKLSLGSHATRWECTMDTGCKQSDAHANAAVMATAAIMQIGLMYAGVARDPNFWGIVGSPSIAGRQRMRTSLADGVFSLWPNAPEDTANFGRKTPLKYLVDTNAMWEPFVAIKMDQDVNGTQSTKGLIKFGTNQFPNCSNWRASTLADGDATTTTMQPWHIHLSSAKIGEHLLEGQTMTMPEAMIDTTSEHIVMPKYAWDLVQKDYRDDDDGGCDLDKMLTLEFHIGQDQRYRVRPVDYVQKTSNNNNKCVRLLRALDDHEPQKWRLGLPFLRNHCVALDLARNRVWISEDRFGGIDPSALHDRSVLSTIISSVLPLLALFVSAHI